MDKAPDYGSGDSGFDSPWRYVFAFSKLFYLHRPGRAGTTPNKLPRVCRARVLFTMM